VPVFHLLLIYLLLIEIHFINRGSIFSRLNPTIFLKRGWGDLINRFNPTICFAVIPRSYVAVFFFVFGKLR